MKTTYPVNVFCVGAQKAGTTTLFDLIVQHPDICEPKYKEIQFFNDPDYLNKFDRYGKEIRSNIEALFHIDFTPSYLAHPLVAERIKAYNPQAKIIIILRNPSERAYSHYKMIKRNGRESRNFETCVKDEIKKLEDGINLDNYKGYVARGLYSVQLERYFAQFDANQIRVYLFEDFVKDQQSIIDDLLSFIGAKPMKISPLKSNAEFNPRINWLWHVYSRVPYKIRQVAERKTILGYLNQMNRKASKKESPDPKTMQILNEYYQNDLIKVEALIHRDLSTYKKIKE